MSTPIHTHNDLVTYVSGFTDGRGLKGKGVALDPPQAAAKPPALYFEGFAHGAGIGPAAPELEGWDGDPVGLNALYARVAKRDRIERARAELAAAEGADEA